MHLLNTWVGNFSPCDPLLSASRNCPLDKGRLSIHWGKGELPLETPHDTFSPPLCQPHPPFLEYGFGLARARGMLAVLSRRSLTSTYRGELANARLGYVV